MVLGSNIGNLMHEKAIDFLKNICEAMSEEDMLFMGFDQKKDPQENLRHFKISDDQQTLETLIQEVNRETNHRNCIMCIFPNACSSDSRWWI